MLVCKNCLRSNHPHYDKKYGGYCLECSNAGVPELAARAAALEAVFEIRRTRGWYTRPIVTVVDGKVVGWSLHGDMNSVPAYLRTGPEELALVVNADAWMKTNIEGKA